MKRSRSISTSEAILHIAVNFGRIARYLEQNNEKRVKLFLSDCDGYLNQINGRNIPSTLQKTYEITRNLANKKIYRSKEDLIDQYYTWANILTHRARLFK
ncbi:hypothetical protein A3G67_03900 [Candidatus Roizmanbacteria bacterium RIFCSPLOWO2_12_FULL_40_12]|uniref:Uncharacterized protein n=1 Tax=Candidatus Roizmanbacteria bacterium RIFCSPLOWO2_01_FULL_40_42 TaxID=1802066 RepID=A0A1F7J5T5_9BACT|nr:MAG: hypothetical protein A2779_03535 [Candidatus Roizmanbacteria bacterium RIFCSPHIGHO2_01_FULL_40_98]OGK28407.1 MAG: hypothetical protein A3C31_00900 [Candidatus Roizmanbacteria bacterium RIFCSPHIGHO2_02_FULL_40_53]OGK30643.1 MAG: hypothetical protein A2W49_03585 [Candidatus Roizmanbacteria bacterium RIFCSPHIGHO2_12_41_18]OGK35971.1 MAG: hypothetical protein A3E69_03270 [Candidatus Roizmanbacteria bacterium RIFCSPHIGHO2_12_FULL_40_130]OGK50963.1 MAG: hypothetical protein A3B50_01670 [Candi